MRRETHEESDRDGSLLYADSNISRMKNAVTKNVKIDYGTSAIYTKEDMDSAIDTSPSRDIIKQPELQLYISEFGKEDDNAFVAEIDGKVVGAVWTRIMNDYGHIDDRTPSFAISLYKEYRGLGIGTEMMRQMLVVLQEKGYRKASLAVQQANSAVRMYQQVGFEIVDKNEEEYIMVCNLK